MEHPGNWLCHFCDETFLERQNLIEHLRTHQDKKTQPNIVVVKRPAPEPPAAASGGSGDKFVKLALRVVNGQTDAKQAKRVAIEGSAERVTFRCDICSGKFLSAKELAEHRAQHKSRCKYCHQEFASFLMERHVKLFHTGGGGYPCPRCDTAFETKVEFVEHLAKYHDNPEESDDDCNDEEVVEEMVVERKPVILRWDKKVAQATGSASYAARVLQRTDNTAPATGVNQESTQVMTSLLTGKQVKVATQPETYTPKGAYMCKHCLRTFQWNYMLQRHLVQKHGGKGKFDCTFCDKSFYEKRDLKKHLTRGHGIKAGFKCDVCGKEFASDKGLSLHMPIHNHDRVYQCDKCDYKSNVERYLLDHRVRQHGVQYQRKRACKYNNWNNPNKGSSQKE